MPTLTRLAEGADSPQYRELVSAWRRFRTHCPARTADAGLDSLFYAVALAFFFKGQPDYPSRADSRRLLAALRRSAALGPRDEGDWRAVLEEMTEIRGIGIPRASVLLHLLHPNDFPIVDTNAADTLTRWARDRSAWPRAIAPPRCGKRQMCQSADGYLEYRRVLLGITGLSGLSLRQVEFALYSAGRRKTERNVTGI